jgi:hypothetical protein
MHQCENCRSQEERVFQDTWTRAKLCLTCLTPIVDEINNSPRSMGEDNLESLLERENAKG